MTGLEPHEASDVQRCQGLLRERMSFIADRSEAGLSQWIDEVQRGLESLIGRISPAQAPAASTPELRAARLDELLGKADALKVRIRNVPNDPSDRYLDKLETQLAGIAEKRAQKLAARDARQARLADLLVFAERLNVRARGVPDNPSDAWLDKMEAKLTEIADRKGIELPQGVQPPSPRETRSTGEPAPQRVAAPPTSLRVQELIHRAEDANLPLGRIPDAPSDDWVSEMEGRLETALQEQRDHRQQERRQRRQRLDQLVQQAIEAGADLGEIPDDPTESWFAAAERQITAAIEARALASAPVAQPPAFDAKRLAEIQRAAAAAGIHLGELPSHPTDDWLAWAEHRIREARDAEAALAVESPTASVASSAYLVYEEGTVQEQIWPVGQEEISIGRSRGNTIQIRDDAAVSRRHAVLQIHSGQYILRDLNSTKGTYVDDQQIDIERVLHGDEVVQFGDTWFTFRLGPAPTIAR
ncbi:MAG TPA: FHA domain-containing protein [Deltaproteobacteria bacterium]|nr:FHA domain-containing protein [Deltaproteobacteria bacterium]